DALGLGLEPGEVIFGNRAVALDFIACTLRNDAETRLDAGKRRFEVQILLDAIFVCKDSAHRLGGKYVTEDTGAHSNGCHSSTFRGEGARSGAIPTKRAGGRPSPVMRRRSSIVRRRSLLSVFQGGWARKFRGELIFGARDRSILCKKLQAAADHGFV